MKELLKQKVLFRKLVAEYIGTFLLVVSLCFTFLRGQIRIYSALSRLNYNLFFSSFQLLGTGTIAAYALNKYSPVPDNLAYALGWGFAVIIATNLAIYVSGAHLNPAVSIANGLISNTEWPTVGFYVIAQFFGAFTAAIVLYLTRVHDITDARENETMMAFVTWPKHNVNVLGALFDQAVATMVLMFVILCLVDRRSGIRPPKYLVPFHMGLVMAALVLAMGSTCGAPLNPARDFAPRLVLLFTGRNHFDNLYWIFGPILGTVSGACLGAFLFTCTLGDHRLMGHESYSASRRAHLLPPDEKTVGHKREKRHIPKPKQQEPPAPMGLQDDLPPLVEIDEATGMPIRNSTAPTEEKSYTYPHQHKGHQLTGAEGVDPISTNIEIEIEPVPVLEQ